MLLPTGSFCRAVHLSSDAQSGKTSKGHFLLRIIITHRFKQTDHPFLDQIIILSANQIHCFRFFAHYIFILFHDIIHNLLITISKIANQLLICQLLIV